MTEQPTQSAKISPLLLAWIAYVAFVVYGSLVPLDFRSVPWDAALLRFQQMPMLRIGPESRADWVSNIVLYVPVGFLSCALSSRRWPRLSGLGRTALTMLFSIVLAVGVEFAQIYFPPRTVALNDIAAEIMGSALGLALANRSTQWLMDLIGRVHTTPRQLVSWLASGYAVAYVLYCLFPFDLVLSADELGTKLASNAWGWWMADGTDTRFVRLLKPVLEALLVIPLGWQVARRLRYSSSPVWAGAVLGAALGTGIELAQLFMVSGTSQGSSVLTRALGMSAGVALWQTRSRWLHAENLAAGVRRWANIAVPVYLVALAEVNHCVTASWLDWYSGLARLPDLHFLPFYYHYYTTEMAALHSLASVALTYAPIGLWAWARRGSPAMASFIAVLLAALIEACKLWLPNTHIHPDPTNVIIAGAAAWCVCRLSGIAARTALVQRQSAEPVGLQTPRQPTPISPPAQGLSTPRASETDSDAQTPRDVDIHSSTGTRSTEGRRGHRRTSRNRRSSGRDRTDSRVGTFDWPTMVVGVSAAAAALGWSIGFPVAKPWLTGVLLACMAVVWWRPSLALTLCLAALPSVALAPWSGRLYIDEFDALAVGLLGIAVWRSPRPAHSSHASDTTLRVLAGLVATALLTGVLRALWPWQTIGPDTLGDLGAPINALRIAKGAVWAACFLALMHRLRRAGTDVRPAIVTGLLTGLVLTLAVIGWERMAFPGLLDFASDYRVTGPFADMNVGGAYIECFLVVATPFLVMAFLRQQAVLDRLLIGALGCALAYGVMVTFSRSGFAAFAVSSLITLVVWTLGRQASTRSWRPVVALLAIMLASAAPVALGTFSQARWATVEADLSTRIKHWDEGLRLREPTSATTWFGVGLGRFPDLHFWNSVAPSRRGSYRLVQDGSNVLLRLGAGHGVYVEQFVDIEPRQRYTLGVNVRSRDSLSVLKISVCERWMLTSDHCVELTAPGSETPSAWRHQDIEFDTKSFTERPWYARRPVKLAIVTPQSGLSIDVDGLTLQAQGGSNLIANGDFTQGLDHWFFTADDHLAWHIKSLPVSLLFDLGWLGLVAFGLLIATALTRSARHAWHGDHFAAACLAALTGFLVVGLFDTLIDTPRFMFLLLLLCGMAARRPHWRPRSSSE